ncbi:hypothetical protein SDC9_130795 [bioreactor metagenome]|uniref:Uncharacterized protein n=1 Tax=bioreactor metagenome TaxID=1076179 RepID=A0A645D2Y8_9ZZZZ
MLRSYIRCSRNGEYRINLTFPNCFSRNRKNLFWRKLFAVKIHHHYFIVSFNNRLNQRLSCSCYVVCHISRNIAFFERTCRVSFIHIGFLIQNVDNSLEGSLFAYGKEKWNSLFCKLFLNIFYCSGKIRMFAIKLTDCKCYRNTKIFCKFKCFACLNLNTMKTAYYC